MEFFFGQDSPGKTSSSLESQEGWETEQHGEQCGIAVGITILFSLSPFLSSHMYNS